MTEKNLLLLDNGIDCLAESIASCSYAELSEIAEGVAARLPARGRKGPDVALALSKWSVSHLQQKRVDDRSKATTKSAKSSKE